MTDASAPDCSRTAGLLRRSIRLTARSGEVRAAVEDDYHHFRVAIRHDGALVTGVESEGVRVPWTMCSLAGEDWSGFIGLPLQPQPGAISTLVDMLPYCTHMYELAGIAMAAVARGVTDRLYELAVPYGTRAGESATVVRDGIEVLRWRYDGEMILDPAPYAGRSMIRGFSRWMAETLDPDTAEAALVLRRGVIISRGRRGNLDAMKTSYVSNACYTTVPERASQAFRVVGSTEDFEMRPDALLAGDRDWLEFA